MTSKKLNFDNDQAIEFRVRIPLNGSSYDLIDTFPIIQDLYKTACNWAIDNRVTIKFQDVIIGKEE